MLRETIKKPSKTQKGGQKNEEKESAFSRHKAQENHF